MGNESATRAAPLRTSAWAPDTAGAGAEFDVGVPVACGRSNPWPKLSAVQRSAPGRGGARDLARRGAGAEQRIFPSRPTAPNIFAAEQVFTRSDPGAQAQAELVNNVLTADRETMGSALHEYEEYVEGPPLEPLAPTPCDTGSGPPCAGVVG